MIPILEIAVLRYGHDRDLAAAHLPWFAGFLALGRRRRAQPEPRQSKFGGVADVLVGGIVDRGRLAVLAGFQRHGASEFAILLVLEELVLGPVDSERRRKGRHALLHAGSPAMTSRSLN